MRKVAMAIPSQGEPPSSISAVLQGFVVVSGAEWAMLLQLLRFGSSYGALAGLTSRPASARSQRAPHTLKAVAVFTSLHVLVMCGITKYSRNMWKARDAFQRHQNPSLMRCTELI